MTKEADIKQKTLELGFDAAGIATADPVDAGHIDYFKGWLDAGFAAKMGYLQRNIEKRFDPGQLLKGAQSVICVALNYRPAADELFEDLGTNDPVLAIACFAICVRPKQQGTSMWTTVRLFSEFAFKIWASLSM